MSTKLCACCGQSFQPDPRVKNHTYCLAPDCQKERRKQWRQTKMKTDPLSLVGVQEMGGQGRNRGDFLISPPVCTPASVWLSMYGFVSLCSVSH